MEQRKDRGFMNSGTKREPGEPARVVVVLVAVMMMTGGEVGKRGLLAGARMH